ncbi:hypothetical protein KR222_004586 [Zaprionus bogoriensis]|nr:hypothetical protein KR222_004586 [Zaprionus bogoriensis]
MSKSKFSVNTQAQKYRKRSETHPKRSRHSRLQSIKQFEAPAMSASMEQLQQLSFEELCIMCLNYGIAPVLVANLDRRNLERRMHVAIISERARMRAHDIFYRIQNEQRERSERGERGLTDWQLERAEYDANDAYDNYDPYFMANDIPLESRRSQLTGWSYFNSRRHSSHMSPYERFRGGVDSLKPLTHRAYDVDAVSIANREDYNNAENSEQSKPSEAIDDAAQPQPPPLQQQECEKVVDNDSEEYDYQAWSQQQQELQLDAATEYLSSFSFEDGSSSGIIVDNVPKTAPTTVTDKFDLKEMERFHWITASHYNVIQETDPDLERSSELELCTIDFMQECSSYETIFSSLHDCYETDQEVDMATNSNIRSNNNQPPRSRRRTRPRPAFWRYVLELVFCNAQGKLDADKLSYSILCCTIVICTYVGVKMLQ